MMVLILFFTFMVVWSWLKSSFTEPGLVMDARVRIVNHYYV